MNLLQNLKIICEKKQKDFENVSKPEHLKDKMDECSLGKDKDGYFVELF